jgi:hypothetical protein
MAGLRSAAPFLIAQSLNQIVKGYGENNADPRQLAISAVAFSTNDERTAKRISDALGHRDRAARDAQLCRPPARALARPCHGQPPGDARPLLTPGEVMQLPASEALVLVSGSRPSAPASCVNIWTRTHDPAAASARTVAGAADAHHARAMTGTGLSRLGGDGGPGMSAGPLTVSSRRASRPCRRAVARHRQPSSRNCPALPMTMATAPALVSPGHFARWRRSSRRAPPTKDQVPGRPDAELR